MQNWTYKRYRCTGLICSPCSSYSVNIPSRIRWHVKINYLKKVKDNGQSCIFKTSTMRSAMTFMVTLFSWYAWERRMIKFKLLLYIFLREPVASLIYFREEHWLTISQYIKFSIYCSWWISDDATVKFNETNIIKLALNISSTEMLLQLNISEEFQEDGQSL